MTRNATIILSILVGLAAALAGAVIPHSIRLGGVELGDIGLPLAGIKAFQHGVSPYSIRLRTGPSALYPFTTMLLLWPLMWIPLLLAVPTFLGLSSGLLSWGLLRDRHYWRLLVFLSPSYWSAIESVQWSIIVTAALLIPALLPIAVLAKPQLGIVAAINGRWSIWTVAATATIGLLSVIIWPAWPMEWLRDGQLETFVGFSPIVVFPGFFLLAAAIAWRLPHARLLMTMSLPMQRYFYDQLPLFLIPQSCRQMTLLLMTSWATVLVAAKFGWYTIGSGVQTRAAFATVVIGVFLPSLGLVLYQHFMQRRAEAESTRHDHDMDQSTARS